MSTRLFEEVDHADLYLKTRPTWPKEIIQKCVTFLSEKNSKPFALAVDVGCGSGQNTRPLAPHFEKVVGIDVSEAQIAAARRVDNPPNVEYIVGNAESIPVPDNSVDLVTCASSVHWFDDIDTFLREADRMLKPCGCIAMYSYDKIHQPWIEGGDEKNQELAEVMIQLDRVLGPYWSHRCHMLASVHIPYAEQIRDDTLDIRYDSTVAGLFGFVRSLTGYRAYVADNLNATDPLREVQERLVAILGLHPPVESARIRVRAPVLFLIARKPEKEVCSQ